MIVEVAARRGEVRSQVGDIMARHGSALADEALLEEVANLVEFPHAVEGRFDEKFLDVPECVLAAAMTGHQRCFPVREGRRQRDFGS